MDKTEINKEIQYILKQLIEKYKPLKIINSLSSRIPDLEALVRLT